MIRRVTVALSAALLGGGIWLTAVTIVRIVDWIVGGTTIGWFTLIGGMVFIFFALVTVDAVTDGKVSGE